MNHTCAKGFIVLNFHQAIIEKKNEFFKKSQNYLKFNILTVDQLLLRCTICFIFYYFCYRKVTFTVLRSVSKENSTKKTKTKKREKNDSTCLGGLWNKNEKQNGFFRKRILNSSENGLWAKCTQL